MATTLYQSNTIQTIKELLPIEEAAIKYLPGTEFRYFGNTMKISCPFHNDRTPSLVIWRDRNYFKCFGCQAHGDQIDLVARALNLTLGETIKLLTADLGIQGQQTGVAYDSIRRREKARQQEARLKSLVSSTWREVVYRYRTRGRWLLYVSSPFDLSQDPIIEALRTQGQDEYFLDVLDYGTPAEQLQAVLAIKGAKNEI